MFQIQGLSNALPFFPMWVCFYISHALPFYMCVLYFGPYESKLMKASVFAFAMKEGRRPLRFVARRILVHVVFVFPPQG